MRNYRSYKLLRDFSQFLRFAETIKNEEQRNKIFFLLERGVAKLNFVCEIEAPSDSTKVN